MSPMNQVTLVKRKQKKNRKQRPITEKGKVNKLVHDVSLLKKEVLAAERKNLYNSFAPTLIDNGGIVSTPINAVTQGDGIFERIGRNMKCTGIDFRYHITAQSAVTAAAIRVIVYMDKKNILPAVADVLYASGGFTVGTSRAPMSFYNRNNRNDFVVLYDKLHDFDYATGDFQAYERVSIKAPHTAKFVDDTAVLAENSIRVLMISDQGLASAARPNIEWVASYYYTDA